MADTLEAIKAVRAVVERSIGEVKAALEATGGDVEAAIDRLITPQERAANRWAAMLKPVRNKTLDDPAPLPRPDAADERDLPKVLADFEAAARARKFWVGEPDVFAVTQLAARHSLPASYPPVSGKLSPPIVTRGPDLAASVG